MLRDEKLVYTNFWKMYNKKLIYVLNIIVNILKLIYNGYINIVH